MKTYEYDVDQGPRSTNKLTRWLMWKPEEGWKYHRTDIVGMPASMSSDQPYSR